METISDLLVPEISEGIRRITISFLLLAKGSQYYPKRKTDVRINSCFFEEKKYVEARDYRVFYVT